MAQKFWVGGNGNISDTAHWSLTSGGASGAAKPTTSDDVIFDNNSGSNYIVTFDETGNTWLSLVAGDSTKKAPQATKNVTLKWATGISTRQIAGNVTIYGDVGYSWSDAEGLNLLVIRATATFKSFSDSKLPTLDIVSAAFGSVVVTMDSGVADSAKTYYVMQQLIIAAGLTSSDKLIFPTQAQGALVEIDDFIIAVAASKNISVDMNSGAVIIIHNSISWSGTGGTITLLNTTGSIVKIVGSNVLWAPFVNTGQFSGVEVTNGSSIYIPQSVSIGTIFLDDNSSLNGNGAILTAGLSPGKNVTISNITIYANNLPLTVYGWFLTNVFFYKSAGVNATLTVSGGTDGGSNINVIFIGSTGEKQKTYRYLVYSGPANRLGGQLGEPAFLGEYTDVFGTPTFSNPINSFGDELVIRRTVNPTSFGEATFNNAGIVGYNYRVDVICYSDFAPNGETIFTGFISQWQPNIENGNQYLDITVLPYAAELSQFIATNTEIDNNDIPFLGTSSGPPATLLTYTSRKIAQSFTTPAGSQAITATQYQELYSRYTYAVRISIQTDSGDAPSGSEVWGRLFDVIPLKVANQQIQWIPSVTTLSGSTKYWLVIEATTDAFSSPAGSMADSKIYTTGGLLASHAAYWDGAAWQKNSAWSIRGLFFYTGQGVTNFQLGTFGAVSWWQTMLNLLADYQNKGGNLGWDSSTTIEDPGINIVYNFNTITLKDAIINLMAFTPAGWYFYVDLATNLFYVKAPPTTPDHLFHVGKDIQAINLQKTMEGVINTIYLTGGDTGGGVTLWREYVESNSTIRYGQRAISYNDNQLIDATTADFVGAKLIAQFKDPTYRASASISGAMGDGYHIEIIRPGDMFAILNINNQIVNLIISEVDYSKQTAKISATTAPPAISSTVIDIKAGLQQVYVTGNPNRPTIIEE